MRNTEDAEKNAQTTFTNGTSGRGQGKGVWGMIEESELAKSIRHEEQKKVDEPVDNFVLQNGAPADVPLPAKQNEESIIDQARSRRDELEAMLIKASSSVDPATVHELDTSVVEAAKEASKALMDLIERTTSTARLEELLALNDNLTGSLARSVPQTGKLQGLGVVIETSMTNGVDDANFGNGHTLDALGDDDTIDDEDPMTPRIDKGKGRAEPEPEVLEPVLSTSFLIAESDDEDGEAQLTVPDEEIEDIVSPTDR